jgi:hypothetical protein
MEFLIMKTRMFWIMLLVLLVVGLVPGVVSAQDGELVWTFEEIGDGIKPALAIDGDGVAHVAYLNEDIMGGTYYATNASGDWAITRVAEGYFYGPVDIAVSAEGVPFIAYHDHQADGFDLALGDEVVATLIDSEWSLVTVRHEGHDGWDNDIFVDAEGFWHTAAVDPAQFGSTAGVEYATNVFGAVVVEDIGSGPVDYEFATSIAVRDDGTVGISYYNSEAQNLVYAERTGGAEGTWSLTTVASEGDVGRYSSLAFDSMGNPHVTYFAFGDGDGGTVHYTHRNAAGEWEDAEIGPLSYVLTGMVGARKITGLALDADDVPHIAYGDRKQLLYAELTEDGWESQVIAELGEDEGFYGQLVEFALDGEGLPRLVYYEALGFNPLRGVVYYAAASTG